MSKNPLVTIYITNYNYSKYIRQSINSAINQSYKNLEIIIVDDCSSDDSIKKINNFKNIKNIKFAFNSKRIGLIKSANKAIKRSKGKYVIRLDGDDILKKDAVKILVKKIRSNKLISMVFPNFDFLHEKQKKIKPYNYKHKKNYNLLDFPAHGACSLIKKNSFKKLGFYEELFDRQDGFYLWALFILNNLKIAHLKNSLFYYRIHGKNLSKNSLRILKERKKIISYFIKKDKSKNKELLSVKKKTEYAIKNFK